MIVDKIYARDLKRVQELAADLDKQYKDVFRASAAGRCVRRLIYHRLRMTPEPMQPRVMRVFDAGNDGDRRFKTMAEELLKGEISFADEEVRWEVLPGLFLTGHIDHLLHDSMLGYIVIEYKTMSNRIFERATKGIIDEGYIAQGAIYKESLSCDGVLFAGERKETSHLVEVLFHNQVHSIGRYGIDDEYVALESPFDDIIPRIREKYKVVMAAGKWEDAMVQPEPVNHYTCHNCDGAGVMQYKVRGEDRTEAQPCKVCKGSRVDPDPVLKYPCSYCPFRSVCYPGVAMTMEGGKPVYRLARKEGLL